MSVGTASDGLPQSMSVSVQRVRCDRQQDDQPLDGLLPLGLAEPFHGGRQVGAEEHQGRSDRAQQGDADQAARQSSAAARDGDSADDDSGDDLELQTGSGVGVDVGESNGVEQGRQAGQPTHDDEDREDDATRPDAGEPRGLGIRASGVNLPADRQVA